MDEERERTLREIAYQTDPVLHALVTAAVHRAIEWERLQPGEMTGERRRGAENTLAGDYLHLLFGYQQGLRKSNATLMAEVIRLTSIIVEPLVIINGVPLSHFVAK
jgi:hypothetical protein